MTFEKPELVLNGYPLSIRHKGVGAYTVRLIQGLIAYAPDFSFRVILPEPLLSLAQDVPKERLHVVPGKPWLDRSIVRDIYWSNRIGIEASRAFPEAVFHSPGEFWSIARPRHTVVTLHDCIYRHFPRLQGGRLRRWWWRATERYARRASLVLTDSEYSRQDLIRFARIPENKCHVLYPWLDDAALQRPSIEAITAIRVKYHLPERFFLYFGGFNVNKNVEFLIRAYAIASRQTALPALVLAGFIQDNLALAVCDVRGAIRENNLSPAQVLTPGFITENDVPALLSAASLLVYPSLYEGFGYPPAEAMCVGTPILVSDATSLPEVVRNPMCRFPLNDTGGLAIKLIEASSSPGQFQCPLPVEFTSSHAVKVYGALIQNLGGVSHG